jgi:phage protein D
MLLDLFSGAQRDPAGCVVKVGVAKLEIADLYPFLTGVDIECSRADAWTATLTFESRRDEQGRWAVQDSGLLSPWESILIEASFGTYSEEIFRGFIREVSASYPEEAGAATVTVECQDQSIALDRTHVRQNWGEADAPTTDGQILQQIIARNPVVKPGDGNGQGLSGLHLFQDATDITFLRDRAEVNGYELIFAEGKVYFGPMRLSGEPQPTILVYAGRDTSCLRFDVKADGHQPEKVAYDVAATEGTTTQQRSFEPDIPLLGTETAAGGGPGLPEYVWRLRRQGTTDEAELDARAQAKANEQAMRIKADGELDGTLYGHVLQVGGLVPVDGVGDRLSGLYYVDTVSHRFSNDGYRQSFKLLRNAYGDNVPSGPLAGLSAAVSVSFSFGI